MIDLVKIQRDIWGVLLSEARLAQVNIVNERKFLLESNLEVDAIWQTPRNGRSGQGIIVEMPFTEVNSPGVYPLVEDVVLPIVCLQNGDMAFTPGVGAMIYAETLAALVLEVLHTLNFEGIGTVQAKGRAREMTNDYGPLNAYRVTPRIIGARNAAPGRVATPTLAVNAGTATLACATSGAEIWFTQTTAAQLASDSPPDDTPSRTLNGTNPNGNSTLYTAPFAVASGDVIRFAAYKTNYNMSEVRSQTMP